MVGDGYCGGGGCCRLLFYLVFLFLIGFFSFCFLEGFTGFVGKFRIFCFLLKFVFCMKGVLFWNYMVCYVLRLLFFVVGGSVGEGR